MTTENDVDMARLAAELGVSRSMLYRRQRRGQALMPSDSEIVQFPGKK
jgi:transposase-like protein